MSALVQEPGAAMSDVYEAPDSELRLLSSPIRGMDLPTFRNYLARALDGDPGVPPSMLASLAAISSNGKHSPDRQELDFWEQLLWLDTLEHNFSDLIRRYENMAAWHHDQAEQALQKMREAADKLSRIDEFISGTNDALDAAAGSRFDRARAIELLKSRGTDVDPNEDDASLLVRLKQEKRQAEEERAHWSAQYEDAKLDKDYHERMEVEDRRKAQELTERRSEIVNSGYAPAEETERLRELELEYGADVDYKAAELMRRQGKSAQAAQIDADLESRFIDGPAKNEEADFIAGAARLSAKFTNASSAPADPARSFEAPMSTPGPSLKPNK